MAQAKDGDKVKVHYTGTLEDGTEFDSSKGRDPLVFAIGKGDIIPGFEQAIIGMSPGESKTEKIPCAEAYGQRREEMVFDIDREQIPEDLEPQVGQRLTVGLSNEQEIQVIVVDVSESNVSVDANHPLAGKDLIFQIELVEIL